MDNTITILITTALADNIVFTYMLGLCPFMSLSKRLDIAIGVGLATTAVLTISCAISWNINYLLPEDLKILQPLFLITIIACVVQATEVLMRLYTPSMHRYLGVFLPLIATNCAILGSVLIALRQDNATFINTTLSGMGNGLGFCLAVVIMASIRDRIDDKQIPPCLQGAPINIITAGFMALTFSAFV